MNNDFSNVKVGDRLWSSIFGWGQVYQFIDSDKRYIVIKSTLGAMYTFNLLNGTYCGLVDDGKYPQSLFFEEMQLVPKPEEAKTFDPNKPYQRRDGKACKIVYTTKEGEFVVIEPKSDAVYFCYANGSYVKNQPNDEDLVNIPEKIEGWVNVYPDMVHETKEVADNHNYKRGTPIRVACIQVSFPKGEGIPDNDFTEKWGYLNGSSVLK